MKKPVSVTNAVKCCNYKNKTPTQKESQYCIKFLENEVEYTNPQLILAVGKLALKAVTGLNTKISELNGKIMFNYLIPVAVCINPKNLLNAKSVNLKTFEKGILPAIKYFEDEVVTDYEIKDTISSMTVERALSIETSSLQPRLGMLKCFSISDGKTATFVKVEDN